MKLDLDTLSLKDLKPLQALVALAELPSKAEDLGFSLAEMMGANIVLKGAPAIPRYANPNKKSEKWSGRGSTPTRFSAAISRGMSSDKLSIAIN